MHPRSWNAVVRLLLNSGIGSTGLGFGFRRRWLQPDVRRGRAVPADSGERVAEDGQVGPSVVVEVADEQPRLVVCTVIQRDLPRPFGVQPLTPTEQNQH